MGSLSGFLQRPVAAASAVAVASISGDLSDRFQSWKSSVASSTSEHSHSHSLSSESVQESIFSWAAYLAVSELRNLSFVTKIRVPVPAVNFPSTKVSHSFAPNISRSSVASSPFMLSLYQSAELGKGPKPTAFTKTIPTSNPDVLYRWHLPEPSAVFASGSDCSSEKSRTVVVLLGWLGSKQKHLKKYAEWYTSRGFHAITFTFPMAEVLSFQVGGKADEDIELLVNHLAAWLEEEDGKNLVFHTFSNTGWLIYGAILEQLQKQDPSLVGRIRGCIVDSAPVAAPDPQVWASGFSAAFLKKNSVATKMRTGLNDSDINLLTGSKAVVEPKPAITEAALLVVLEKFFGVVLNLPSVKGRLSDVLSLLSSAQPSCPQLYIYSSADKVIPAGYVESFIEKQRRAGHQVRACNFVNTPHVDHFRNDPNLYTTQLGSFLDDCVLTRCTRS